MPQCTIINEIILLGANYMKRTEIKALYAETSLTDGLEVIVAGWVKTSRESKSIGFLEINDGSCFKNLQIIVEDGKLDNFKTAANTSVGSSVIIKGKVVLTPGAKQPFELNADEFKLEGECPSDYPLQKKRHSLEFLRTMPHLRARTNTYSAAFRVRS